MPTAGTVQAAATSSYIEVSGIGSGNPYWNTGGSGYIGIRVKNKELNQAITVTLGIWEMVGDFGYESVLVTAGASDTICTSVPCTVANLEPGQYVDTIVFFTPTYVGHYDVVFSVEHGVTTTYGLDIEALSQLSIEGPNFIGTSNFSYPYGLSMQDVSDDQGIYWKIWTSPHPEPDTEYFSYGGRLGDWYVPADKNIGYTFTISATGRVWFYSTRATKEVQIVENDLDVTLKLPDSVQPEQPMQINIAYVNKGCDSLRMKHQIIGQDEGDFVDGNLATFPAAGIYDLVVVVTCDIYSPAGWYSYNYDTTVSVEVANGYRIYFPFIAGG